MARVNCNCDNVLRAVNVLSLLTHGGIVVAGVYGVIASMKLVDAGAVASSGAIGVVSGVSGSRLGLFTGEMAVYFVLLGALGMLAEVRTDCMRKRVLRPIGFLDHAAGRAALLFYLGSMLMLIPWDDLLYIPRIPGGFAIFCSVCQLMVAIFVKPEGAPLTGGTAKALAAAAKNGTPKAVGAAAIQWGAPGDGGLGAGGGGGSGSGSGGESSGESGGGGGDAESGGGDPAGAGGMETPGATGGHRRELLQSARSASGGLRRDVSGGGGGGDFDGGVVVANPFAAASAALAK